MVHVLERAGVQRFVPRRADLLRATGLQRRDERPGARNGRAYHPGLRARSGAGGGPLRLVRGMIRHGYLELFAGDPVWLPRAQALAERTYEFTEFLVDVLGVTDLGARYPGKLTYHSSCHLLRELGVRRQPRRSWRTVREARVGRAARNAKTAAVSAAFSRSSTLRSRRPCWSARSHNIEASGAPVVVACDAGCLTNINGGLHRRGKPQRVVLYRRGPG